MIMMNPDSATSMIVDRSINLGFDLADTDKRLDEIGVEGLLVISDLVNIVENITHHQPSGEARSYMDIFLPNALTMLLHESDMKPFTERSQQFKMLVAAMTEGTKLKQYTFFADSERIMQLFKDTFSCEEFMEVLPTLSEAKVRAIMVTLMDFVEHSILGHKESGVVEKALAKIVPVLNIVDEQDGEKVQETTAAYSYRKNYVKQVFPYPDFGKRNIYSMTDSIIDRLAELHSNPDPDRANDTAYDFSMFLRQGATNTQVEEAFSYFKLIDVLDSRSWITVFESLRNMVGAPHSEDYSKLTGTQRKQCEALITVIVEAIQNENVERRGLKDIATSNEENEMVWDFPDQRVVALLMDHPERAEEVTAIIRERSTLDWETVFTVLGIAPALSAGAL